MENKTIFPVRLMILKFAVLSQSQHRPTLTRNYKIIHRASADKVIAWQWFQFVISFCPLYMAPGESTVKC